MVDRPKRERTASSALAFLLAVALVTACGAAEPTPTVTVTPRTAIHVSVDGWASSSPEERARGADLIVVGRVTQILPARWNTRDGKRPADPTRDPNAISLWEIVTPVVLTLDGPPIANHAGADLSQGAVVIAEPGGQVGQDTITYGGLVITSFRLGEHVLVGLNRDYDPSDQARRLIPTEAGPAWDPTFAYLVMANGTVVASDSGATEPLPDLIGTMTAAAASATPTP